MISAIKDIEREIKINGYKEVPSVRNVTYSVEVKRKKSIDHRCSKAKPRIEFDGSQKSISSNQNEREAEQNVKIGCNEELPRNHPQNFDG